jgi:hypothetical protein
VSDRVPRSLIALADLYRARHKVYGNSNLVFGELARVLFPRGLMLTTVCQFNRAAIVFHIVDKLIRYSNNFHDGGHRDSLDDISVYAMMLRDMDE